MKTANTKSPSNRTTSLPRLTLNQRSVKQKPSRLHLKEQAYSWPAKASELCTDKEIKTRTKSICLSIWPANLIEKTKVVHQLTN